MINYISIRNFTLIESLDLDIAPKLSVITGETGAGKSTIIGALNLLLGKRAQSSLIRQGAKQADISACFEVSTNQAATQWLSERDMLERAEEREHSTSDELTCLIRRVITSDGRSRCFINGLPTTLTDMKQLTEMLLSIHGQHQNQMLLKKDYQLSLLDQFANTAKLQQSLQANYNKRQQIVRTITQQLQASEQLKSKSDLLDYQINELKLLELEQDQYRDLEMRHHQLANAETVTALCNQIHQQLDSTTSTESLLDTLRRAISQLEPYGEKEIALKEICDMLESAAILISEAASNLAHHIDAIEHNPRQLELIEQRLTALHNIARKHNISPNDLLEKLNDLEAELATIDDQNRNTQALEADAEALQSVMKELAEQLSQGRQKAIPTLETLVTEQIRTLGLPNAQFSIELSPSTEISPFGKEHIEFMIRTNPGQPAGPLRQVASGGELSRISLAIQVICSTKEMLPPTMVFDEVDSGVGGAVAESVGRLLRQLGEQGQIICITHLPQVASQGHHHMHVNKIQESNRTFTEITSLSTDKKVLEIARMLGGIEISERTIEHAKEMLKEADAN